MILTPLSVVVTSRNDNHGADLNSRTQRHIDCLYSQASRFHQPVEYIFVEWNPPDCSPPVWHSLNFHPSTEYWHPRIITVPPEIHNTLRYSDRLAIFQMIAKNVGIRRSTGEYVLCTNIDILLSDEMFQFVTGPLLHSGYSYRTTRVDVGTDVPTSPPEMMDYCRNNILRYCYPSAVADYTVPGYVRKFSRVYHWSKHHAALKLWGVPDVHTMACGDFALLHRDDWAGLRGYPEMQVFSIHIDSLLLLQAYYSGIKEFRIPFPVYHIEHAIGTSLVPGGDAIMYKNLTEKGVPYLPLTIIPEAAGDMRDARENGMFRKYGDYWAYHENGPDWGMATEKFREVRV